MKTSDAAVSSRDLLPLYRHTSPAEDLPTWSERTSAQNHEILPRRAGTDGAAGLGGQPEAQPDRPAGVRDRPPCQRRSIIQR